MVNKKVTRKRVNKVKEVIVQQQPTASKNLMGLSGFAMIILTNYQTEIKKTFEIIYGFLK